MTVQEQRDALERELVEDTYEGSELARRLEPLIDALIAAARTEVYGWVAQRCAEVHAGRAAPTLDADRLRALESALEGLVRKMAPHSGSCCTFAEDGTVVVTPESCKCGPVERAAHEVLDWYGTTWKRGSKPSGVAAARALLAGEDGR